MCMGQMVKCLFLLHLRLGVIKNRQNACRLQNLVTLSHRTTGCFNDRLLTMMTETGLGGF